MCYFIYVYTDGRSTRCVLCHQPMCRLCVFTVCVLCIYFDIHQCCCILVSFLSHSVSPSCLCYELSLLSHLHSIAAIATTIVTFRRSLFVVFEKKNVSSISFQIVIKYRGIDLNQLLLIFKKLPKKFSD